MHRVPEGLGGGEAAAGLGDGAMEQPPGARHGQERMNAARPGRFPENRHLRRIPAVGRDVIAHPAEGLGLIEKAVVSGNALRVRGGEGGVGEEPHHAKAIVDGDHHHPLSSKGGAIIGVRGPRTPGEAAAVNPHHHRRFPLGVGGPDVQVEAVLRGGSVRPSEHAGGGVGRLGALGREIPPIPGARPGRRRFRGRPAPGPGGGQSVGNGLEDRDAVLPLGTEDRPLGRGQGHRRSARRRSEGGQ